MPKFAANTTVNAAKSRAEIETTLMKYGATGFVYGYQDTRAMIEFIMKQKKIRISLELPARDDPKFRRSPGGRNWRDEDQAYKAWEQSTRQCWRSLALIIKAKLVAVAEGIKTFEQEFMADIVMPDGRTVAEHAMPIIEQAYLTNTSPRLLTAGT